MIKPILLIKLLEQRLRERQAFLDPIPPEATLEKSQSVIDAYKQCAEDEVKFLKMVLEKKNL